LFEQRLHFMHHNSFFHILISIMAGIYFGFIAAIIACLLTETSLDEFINNIRSPEILSSIIISLETSIAVVILALIFGIPVAYLLATRRFKGRIVLDTLIDLPIISPPLVCGLAIVRERLRYEMKQLQRDVGLTTIYVTHDQVEAMMLGDRIAVLNNGQSEEVGTPEKIFYKPQREFVARFIGMKNIFNGKITTLDEEGGVMQISTENFELTTVLIPSSEGTHVKACVRPEEIILMKSDQKTSARNEIAGRIITIFPNGPLMRVLVDVGGDEISVDITRLATRDLGLKKGDKVILKFKATSVHVII